MSAVRPHLNAYRFGPFRLSVPDRILERNGERVHLTPKVIDTLFVLVRNPRHVVTKEELMKAVWPDVTVVESGLTRNISALRKALEEGEAEGSYIETIPRRGYRFMAPVIEEPATAADETPHPTPPVTAPADAGKASRPVIWIGIGCVILLGLAIVWAARAPVRGQNSSAIAPSVRIGEHLLYKLAPKETIRASEHFEQAITADPNNASAHAGLSVSLLHLALLGVRSLPDVMPRAEEAARRSRQLDQRLSTAHYATAMVHLINWDFRTAEQEFGRALKLDRDSVQGRLGYARLKMVLGDVAGAQRLVEQALQLDPASPALGAEYCQVFYYRREFHRAEAECRKVLDREPGFALAHYYLALTLGWLDRIDEAHENLDQSGLMPGVLEADRAWLQLRGGDRRPAEAALERQRELLRRRQVDPSATLLLAASLNHLDEAYDSLEACIAGRAPELLTLHVEPRLDAIRTDSRYQALLRRISGRSAHSLSP